MRPLAEDNWNAKFKAALDISDKDTKAHYDKLLDLRAQVRNFVAHGAFGKEGKAFRFHSGAGSVPVLLTNDRDHQVSFTGRVADYDAAWHQLQPLALSDLPLCDDALTVQSILGALALCKGQTKLGALISDLTDSELGELVNEQMGWDELYKE